MYELTIFDFPEWDIYREGNDSVDAIVPDSYKNMKFLMDEHNKVIRRLNLLSDFIKGDIKL